MQNQKRETILEAIKQTAKTNGGVPLGKQAFSKQTGIKDSEWYGVYWVRWSDVLKEAGFTPNAYNKRADKSVLLEKLVPAIRHFGKFPTYGEFRLYSKTNSNFPAHNTIHSHFPTKTDLITQMAAYVVGKPELQDIAVLCKEFDVPEKDIPESAIKEGHVYLFKSGDYYKIGKTDNLERRVKEVTVTLPEALTIIHTIRTDDPDGIEAYWHRRFNDRRAKGEWFKLSVSNVRAFKRRTFQ